MKTFLFFSALLMTTWLKADDVTAVVSNAATGMNNGAVIVSVSGGISPYSFAWTGPDGFISYDQNISDLAPGDYCVTVTDVYCGTAQLCVTVAEEPLAINDHAGVAAFVLYPDPCHDHIVISLALQQEEEGEILVLDVSGNTITEMNVAFSAGENTFDFATDVFPAGMYCIVIKCGEAVMRKTFVRQ